MTAFERTSRTSYGRGRVVARARRVLLRYPKWSDQAELLALRRESWDFLRPWEPDLPGVDPLGAGWFARYMRFGTEHGRLRYLVQGRRAGRIYGSISLGEFERDQRRAAVGYWIGAPFARRGYMSEALHALSEDVLPALGFDALLAFVLPENRASKGLLASVGFERCGTAAGYRMLGGVLRDHERWLLVARKPSER